ncbi:MAG: hypothetical protein GEU86_22365 [Actinophytocola sp.]|nr:hypothetical protein [Actinophytocola sp.]
MNFRRIFVALAATAVMLTAGVAAHAAAPGLPGPLADPFAGATVTELIAPKPSWYTDALHAKAVAAAEKGEGIAIPDGVDYPASGLAFTGIRPGAWIIAPAGCTTNFVFGSAGNYSIGTAGHCAEVGDEVTLIAAPGVLMVIGKTVKSVDNGVGDDFALIDIYPEMQQYVNSSMTYFGGPTSVGSPQFGDVVEHAGHGLVIGTGGTPRAGVVVYRGPGDDDRGDAFAWDGAASPGDSGSAVRLATGEAAGDLTHLVVGGPYVPGVVAGTSIERMLRIAGKSLATAPNVPDPLY